MNRYLAVAVLAFTMVAPMRAADVPNVLPAETEQIVYVNFRQILESDLMKKFALGQFKQALKQNDAQKMLEEIGLDPLKDLDKVYAGFWGKDPQNMDGVAVITGKFDADKLLKAAEKTAKDKGDKVAIVEEGDYKLIKITGDKGKPFYASVANEKTIIGGSDKKLVVAGLKAVVNNGKPTLSKELAALVLKQDDKASMWLVGMTEGKLGEVNVPEIPGVDAKALKTSLNKLNNIAFTIRLGEDVTIALTGGMKDADAADEFAATLGKLVELGKAFLPLAANNAPQAKPLIDDIVKTIKSEAKEKDVKLSFKLSGDAIGKAAEGDKEKDKE